ncbi:MAG: hypothetical protein JSU03_05055 [Bacteroidetes bacterium]|nr:hypothetical protein [Bacteroidota bacterium]
MAKVYKIKSEDKAALLNKLEKLRISVDSYSITDNKLEGYFEFQITNPVAEPVVQKVLASSPKIDQLKEVIEKIIRRKLGGAESFS